MKLVTAQEMRTIDATTIEQYGIPGIVLMENAGRHVAEVVREMLRDVPDGNVFIVCGKGNNGGDGFVVARHLANEGHDVNVALLGSGADLPGDAGTNYQIARNMGIPIDENADEDTLWASVVLADIIVDAILGTGSSGEARGMARTAIDAINAGDAWVVAVDIPSGIDSDTGTVAGVAVRADVTVTFGLPKLGLSQYPGIHYRGELRVADITIPRDLLVSSALKANLVTPETAEGMLPERGEAIHKGDAGRVLVVAGSAGMTGAAALCSLGAVRSGAGLVTLACPAGLNDILEAKCTEVVSLPLPETSAHSLAPAAKAEVLNCARHCDVVALGPGLSQHHETATFVRETVPAIPSTLVMDADGINCLDADLSILRERGAPTIITPHPGELARLMGTTIEEVQADRIAAARVAAAEIGCVVVLKGAASVIAEPAGEVWINSTGNHGMASGGTGDVLTGVISAFAAGGAGPIEAAVAGVYYHGLAGDMAGEKGRRGLTATDLLTTLQSVLPD